MTVEEFKLIRISLLNKVELDDFKLFERESYNLILGELIRFGKENGFKDVRIKNLNKKLGDKENGKIKLLSIKTTG